MTTTGTLTITDFLLARIAEDEAAVYRWDSAGPSGAVVASVWTGEGPGYATVAASSVEGVWVADGHEVEDPRHVHMLFDPARVLAECKVRRAIVEAHPNYGSTVCDNCRGEEVDEWFREPWPCATIRQLAAVYASHPDYNPAWAPES